MMRMGENNTPGGVRTQSPQSNYFSPVALANDFARLILSADGQLPHSDAVFFDDDYAAP